MPQFLLTFDFLYLYYFFFFIKRYGILLSTLNDNIFKTLYGFLFLSLNGHFSLKIFIVKTDRNAKLQCEIT